MSAPSKKPSTILVVDDDPLVAELLKTRLTSFGYDVIVANSAEDGLALDAKMRPDLILLDVVLPEMSGFEACQKFNTMHKDRYVPVLLITSMDALDSKIKGLDSGAYDYMTKPFEAAELLARVRSALRTKGLYDELQDTRAKLTEAEKLATLGEMVITLRHEINNPLQAIMLSAENLLNDLKEGNVSKEDIETVIKSCERITETLRLTTRLKRIRSSQYVGDADMLDLDKSAQD